MSNDNMTVDQIMEQMEDSRKKADLAVFFIVFTGIAAIIGALDIIVVFASGEDLTCRNWVTMISTPLTFFFSLVSVGKFINANLAHREACAELDLLSHPRWS